MWLTILIANSKKLNIQFCIIQSQKIGAGDERNDRAVNNTFFKPSNCIKLFLMTVAFFAWN